MNSVTSKKISDSAITQTYIVFSSDLNGYGRVFGGRLLSWLDIAANIVARKHSEQNTTTVAVDNMRFFKPIQNNELAVIKAKLVFVGRTSMEVLTTAYTQRLDGSTEKVGEAYFTMVALDEAEKPAAVPCIVPETDEEKELFAAAEKRYRMRKQ